jgi:hypothetical protein
MALTFHRLIILLLLLKWSYSSPVQKEDLFDLNAAYVDSDHEASTGTSPPRTSQPAITSIAAESHSSNDSVLASTPIATKGRGRPANRPANWMVQTNTSAIERQVEEMVAKYSKERVKVRAGPQNGGREDLEELRAHLRWTIEGLRGHKSQDLVNHLRSIRDRLPRKQLVTDDPGSKEKRRLGNNTANQRHRLRLKLGEEVVPLIKPGYKPVKDDAPEAVQRRRAAQRESRKRKRMERKEPKMKGQAGASISANASHQSKSTKSPPPQLPVHTI